MLHDTSSKAGSYFQPTSSSSIRTTRTTEEIKQRRENDTELIKTGPKKPKEKLDETDAVR